MQNLNFKDSAKGSQLAQTIHEQFHIELLLYARALCRRRGFDESQADDLMQDFYYTVMTKAEQVEIGLNANGIGYLVTMLKNENHNQERKRSASIRRDKYFSDHQPRIAHLFSLCSEEQRASFFQELEKILIDEKDLEVMILYIKGYSYKEIVQRMDMPMGTVSSKISRSKEKIAQHYGWPPRNKDEKGNEKLL